MLLARIVGPSGEVVGIERDAYSIARANARIAEAGLRNVGFTEADANQIYSDQPFDAAVGRFILMFLPAIHETFLRAGVNPEMGITLYQIFQQVGLPTPAMHMETPLGSDANLISLICDLVSSMRPLIQQHNVSLEALGSLDTLSERIQAEVVASNTVVSFVPIVGAWARKPMST
jgi:hypothetical protein